MCKLSRRTIVLGASIVSVSAFFAGVPLSMADDATERASIDSDVNEAIANLYKQVPGSRGLVARSKGALIFPSVVSAGVGIGGQYGKGALRVHRRSVAYYSTVAASVGFQLGAQSRSMVFLFMTDDALSRFENSSGWDVGGDASVAVVKTGANGAVDLSTANQPVVALIYGNAGLMYDLSLNGTKVSKLDISGATGESTGSSQP
jgi:lipid-binding SYLF domain-containing protein